ncbi:MAG TPA: NADH-quinone oxidoreductase subunit C [Candidatus Bathyarchaeia archaeon]|nr:NADH-quinone oxidoreductase subunit C [Candidatus Bathyarchaeia archaeon]
MANEETIRQELGAKFPFLAEKIAVRRERRIFADVPADRFMEVFEHAAVSMGFTHLCTITGLDEGENLAFVYILARPDGTILSLKQAVPKAKPVIKTISGTFPGGAIYERELVDLFGAEVEGLPPGKRYPLPDNWPVGQYPLRKDWKPEMLDGAGFSKGDINNG